MYRNLFALAIAIMATDAVTVGAQQKEEITITTAVSNLAFSAVWVAEQLKYFDQEGVRAKVVVAGGGSQCQSAVVGRSAQYLRVVVGRLDPRLRRRRAADRRAVA